MPHIFNNVGTVLLISANGRYGYLAGRGDNWRFVQDLLDNNPEILDYDHRPHESATVRVQAWREEFDA